MLTRMAKTAVNFGTSTRFRNAFSNAADQLSTKPLFWECEEYSIRDLEFAIQEAEAGSCNRILDDLDKSTQIHGWNTAGYILDFGSSCWPILAPEAEEF